MIKDGFTEREWKRIAAVLPPPGGVGRPRRGDREALAILFRAEALSRTRFVKPALQELVDRKTAAVLVVKRARWREDGIWSKLLEVGAPAIERLRERELRRYDNSDTGRLMRHVARSWASR